jgi:hypothetical protein
VRFWSDFRDGVRPCPRSIPVLAFGPLLGYIAAEL